MVQALKASSEFLAAIDLGSNSFHLVIAECIDGDIRIVDRQKEFVRLAAGLSTSGELKAKAKKRAIRCLKRFSQRIRDFNSKSVRAVGTNTLRQAKNSSAFVAEAEEALGHPIDIVSGLEEARLVYSGVAHSIAYEQGRRLVVDIGGGSSECIIGEGFECIQRDSLYMGCVSYSERFFGDGRITKSRFKEAKLSAQLEIVSLERAYLGLGWRDVVGSSGTIRAVEAILREKGWAKGGITLSGIERLETYLIKRGHVENLSLVALDSQRAPVFPGGVAILISFFKGLGIKIMHSSRGALREGLLYDTFGRIQHQDLRERTVGRMLERYRVDINHAASVENLALNFLKQVPKCWGIQRTCWLKFMRWAVRLHEVGMSIGYRGYHKHGGYFIEHSDMPGFSLKDKDILALLIRGHRRKIPHEHLEMFSEPDYNVLVRLLVIIRLSVLFNRSRGVGWGGDIELFARGSTWKLCFSGQWLEKNPLSVADLTKESSYLKDLGQSLIWVGTN